jgi:hypothetical protein
MKNNFIINLFGTGIRYWICEVPIEMYDKMQRIKDKYQVEWENLLFDFDFLKHFGFNHWSELSSHPEEIGFLLIPENRIEIKCGAKFVARFRAIDLNSTATLFPLFRTSEVIRPFDKKPTSKSFILIHYEKGLIAKYQFVADHVEIEDLDFQLENCANYLILKNINYRSALIPSVRDDSLTISTKVLEL